MSDIVNRLKSLAFHIRETHSADYVDARTAEQAADEIERLRALVYASPPADPFAGDGYTWKQQAEKAESALASAEAAALTAAADLETLADAIQPPNTRGWMLSDAPVSNLPEDMKAALHLAIRARQQASVCRSLIPPGHSPAPAGEAQSLREKEGVHLGLLDDMDHEAKYSADAEYRNAELRIHALGAAISRRDWHAVEQAHAAIRDKFYSHRDGASPLAQKEPQP